MEYVFANTGIVKKLLHISFSDCFSVRSEAIFALTNAANKKNKEVVDYLLEHDFFAVLALHLNTNYYQDVREVELSKRLLGVLFNIYELGERVAEALNGRRTLGLDNTDPDNQDSTSVDTHAENDSPINLFPETINPYTQKFLEHDGGRIFEVLIIDKNKEISNIATCIRDEFFEKIEENPEDDEESSYIDYDDGNYGRTNIERLWGLDAFEERAD